MPVTTLSAAVHITPTVIKTFVKHTETKGKNFRDDKHVEEATDDIFFDESFHIVKKFIEMGTKNTVESLQAFTNTHVPSPPWAAVSPVCIPFPSCNRAADLLIEWFGPDDIKHVVGGERWWQVRGLDGIDGEWITEKEYLSSEKPSTERKLNDDEEDILRMEGLDSVMLYVHGGGYFWGSINTHRYQIIRYARKFKGRAFAVNYRKAPQYPWPCPLQDVIAAYLYLIDPPPTALHKPVPPSKIVFAGDSAGGGLCLTVLTVLRDMGLEMPAGAVLISPWVDLTHSFPSVMHNTQTDIIPPHGFLAKPSTLWPIELLPPTGSARVVTARSNPPPVPGHADTLRPSDERVQEEVHRVSEGKPPIEEEERVDSQEEMFAAVGDGENLDVPTKGEGLDMHDANGDKQERSATNEKRPRNGSSSVPSNSNDTGPAKDKKPQNSPSVPDTDDVDFWQPKPPKVLMEDPKAIPLELRSQIQLYATNEQLTHPLVSPVLQGSLGNLPPLYILAGDGEVLRDEIVYIAHRAAHPDEFPVREGVLRDGRRQKENVEKFRTPTKVHLQVFDGMCHVLTVFSFTNSAKYAYRSIAEFVKHVTHHPEEHLIRNPFPELHRPPSSISTDSELERSHRRKQGAKAKKNTEKNSYKQTRSPEDTTNITDREDIKMYRDNEEMAMQEVKEEKVERVPPSMGVSEASISAAGGIEDDIPNILMIRERVDIHGRARPMEPKSEVPALQLRPAEVGIIKEAPCQRWAAGQAEWDKRYKRSAENAMKQRKRNESKAKRVLDNARDQGLLLSHDREPPPSQPHRKPSHMTTSSTKGIQEDRRWGPLDLEHERPPLSSIAKRRDTQEALALLKMNIYHSAPSTHKTVPKLKTIDAIRAAFDANDDPIKPPKQSVSEQQVRTHIIPVHGLRIWDSLLSYFMRKSSRKAIDGARRATAAAHRAGERVGIVDSQDNGREGSK